MNSYVFIFILLLIGVGAYLFMSNNHDQIANAMTFGTTPAASSASPMPNGGTGDGAEANPYDGSNASENMPPTNLPKSATADNSGSSDSSPIVPPNIATAQATGESSSSIDAAAVAAAASSSSQDIGTVKTLTGHTYTNCKVLKVEADGVTFNCDDGIIKVLYLVMPPDLQKKFGSDSQKAVQPATAVQPTQ